MSFEHPVYPFTAIVGQENPKLTLILNAIDPSIGGALITGPKGSGKSLIVRAAEEILPNIDVVSNCAFNCSPLNPTNMCETCRSLFEKIQELPSTRRQMKIVQIPIGATEDRVIGTINVEKTLREGTKSLEPCILSKANQNILYIDEVNLLPDHITDDILDAAASGWNVVEREGISFTHPSRFVLVGAMNPEEGDLRPQILDRFGLHAKTENLNFGARMDVIRRNEDFDRDPTTFCALYKSEQEALRERIETARDLLPQVKVTENILESVAKLCANLQVDGHRPDVVITRVIRALAAFDGRLEVQPKDTLIASELTLSHRTRRGGLEPPPSNEEIYQALKATSIGKKIFDSKERIWKKLNPTTLLKKLKSSWLIKMLLTSMVLFIGLYIMVFSGFWMLYDFFNLPMRRSVFSFEGVVTFVWAVALTTIVLTHSTRKKRVVPLLDFSKIITDDKSASSTFIEDTGELGNVSYNVERGKWYIATLEQGRKILENFVPIQNINEQGLPKEQNEPGERHRLGKRYLSGKRAKIITSTNRGRYIWPEFPRERPWDIALGPTIRAAAPYQEIRRPSRLRVAIRPQDFRVKTKEYRAPFIIVLLVDMSWSMVRSMANLARAIFSLHRSVYRRRDHVGLIVFKGSKSFVLQRPTTNLNLVVSKLLRVGVTDFTPLASGMLSAWRILKFEKRRNPDATPMLIIISDGITNVPLDEELSTSTRQMFMSKPQADAMDVARLIAREGIRTFIINTFHRTEQTPYQTRLKWYSPSEFLMEIAKVTKGNYHGLNLNMESEMPLELKGTTLEDQFYFEADDKSTEQ